MKKENEKAGLPGAAEINDTAFEGRDADRSKGEAEYNFPVEGITVVATSEEEAKQKMLDIKKQREQSAATADEAAI